MKRKSWVFLFFLLLVGKMILFMTPVAEGTVKLAPAKLYIDMPEKYSGDDVQYDFRVTNLKSYSVLAIAKVIHPWDLTENYDRIPSLSWVEIIPEQQVIPANGSKEFEIILNIPDEEKPLHYNKSWEIWFHVSFRYQYEEGDHQTGVFFQPQLVSRVFINTPLEEMKFHVPQSIYIILGGIMGFVALAMLFFYVRNKRKIEVKRAAIFYVKKKGSRKHNKKI